jgi:hypothetical protein
MSFATTLLRSSRDFFGSFAEHFSRQYSWQTHIPVVVMAFGLEAIMPSEFIVPSLRIQSEYRLNESESE